MRSQASKLFKAVVVSGAALTSSCERGSSEPITRDPSNVERDASVTESDAGLLKPLDAGKADAACPPGSEMPFPPCYYIR